MAVALLSKKKLKSRSRHRSPGSRAFEEEDEDMVIISRLEKEPWQPDLLLERQSDKSTAASRRTSPDQQYVTHQTPLSTAAAEGLINLHSHNNRANNDGKEGSGGMQSTNRGGFQGVIPVIIKSPSSVITTADADAESCVESIFEDHAPKIPGIEEYLQQTHQEQQLLQQQKQEMQIQMQMQQLQYQLPAHLQSTGNIRRQEQRQEPEQQQQQQLQQASAPPQQQLQQIQPLAEVQPRHRLPHQQQIPQQYRNSFHGHSAAPFLSIDEQQPVLASRPRPLSTFESNASTRSISPSDSKIMTDNEDVIESLQSLKNITMLALDGLLQQVVSDVTARDPVYNPDETTLQARALIRRRSIPLLDLVAQSQPSQHQHQQHYNTTTPDMMSSPPAPASAQRSISNTPIAGMATSSLERLDELVRKVDQLAAVAATDEQQLSSGKTSFSILHEPLDIPVREQQSQSRTSSTLVVPQEQEHEHMQPRMDPTQVFESQEYQLACALAAMLACIYRILNGMQQEPRVPKRTESVDSGLDQAARLWKRLSSNSFRNPLRPSPSPSQLNKESMTMMTASHPSSPEKRILAGLENGGGGTNGFIQSLNKQVRTLRSRRTQSTSHIEAAGGTSRSLQGRILGGLGLGASSKSQLHPEDATQVENAKELEQEWTELDRLMDDMAHLWRFVGGLEDGDEEDEVEDANEEDPFHDRNQVQVQPQPQAVALSSMTVTAGRQDFDQQTLDMSAMADELPKYDDEAPLYRLSEKSDSTAMVAAQTQSSTGVNLARRTSRGARAGISSVIAGSGLDDEKTRFDLNNVMSAIDRLSKVAPRMDDQRVQLSPSQKRTMARASVAHTIERLSRDQEHGQAVSGSSSSSRVAMMSQQASAERNRDLNKLVNQIVESAAKASQFTTQRAEFSPRQQWKLEGARVGDRIERGEKLRMSDQDWQSPEKVLLKDMTRLTNALYQQSATASSQAFATQRFTLTEDKARNMALQGIISKIERVSGRRMENQDALPPTANKSRPGLSSSGSASGLAMSTATPGIQAPAMIQKRGVAEEEPESLRNESSGRAKELQDMINQVVGGGGGPTRKSAMASQRAQFGPK